MLIDFFFALKSAKVPVSIREYLMLLEGLKQNVIEPSIDQFYFFSRTALVKDEQHYDKFDQAFGAYFKGVDSLLELDSEIPLDWLLKRAARKFTAEEKARIEALGGLDALMQQLKELLAEQKERHEGGDKWIGTGGTSPFGHSGFNPEGIRIGGDDDEERERKGVKVWEARAYRDYDDQVELGTRNIKIALRRLRKFARDGSELELDLPDTIGATARNAGWLDIKMIPERRNNVKILMLLDAGGSMDDHVRRTEELFSAARAEFKHLDFFYFHNCIYEYLWKHNRRRHAERTSTWELLHKYPPDTRLIIVGDATMSPYEVTQPGGSVEYNNDEAGAVWLQRFVNSFPKFLWLNPEPEGLWQYRQSVQLIRQIMRGRMVPVTIEGLERGMRMLSK